MPENIEVVDASSGWNASTARVVATTHTVKALALFQPVCQKDGILFDGCRGHETYSSIFPTALPRPAYFRPTAVIKDNTTAGGATSTAAT